MNKTNNFPVIEMFHSIQGEGKYMGVPSFFVRVTGCNLRCVFRDSICDTPYSSFDPEKSLYPDRKTTVAEFRKLLEKYPNTTHIVITGGEPMLYQKGMFDFLYDSTVGYNSDDNYKVTIETNGTISPEIINNMYLDMVNNMAIIANFRFELISISPKLVTSEDNRGILSKEAATRHKKLRLNIPVLREYYQSYNVFKGIQYKFVYSGDESVEEIHKILDKIAFKDDKSEINDKVYLMPEGTTINQVNDNTKDCVECCIKNGWNFAPRLHILIWGDKRGV